MAIMRAGTLCAIFLLAACAANGTRADSPAPAREPTDTAAATPADEPEVACGMSSRDWCPSPEGDPCGEHADEESCRGDARCVGLPYRGESFVACQPDGHGFWTNCPAVGCVSKPAG